MLTSSMFRTRSIGLALTFLLSSAGTVAFTTSCAQPVPSCASALGYFGAEYELVEGDPMSVCGSLLGDELGIQTYYSEGGPNGTPNYADARIAIRPLAIGSMVEYAEIRGAIDEAELDDVFHSANAIGEFDDSYPDDDLICSIPEFDASSVSLPAIEEILDDPMTMEEDESMPPQPAIEATYQWSNARFIVSANIQGTQFEADLDYTQDGCTAKYRVRGVYPVVYCATDDECNDDANGMNPDFATHCNLDLGFCVLDGDIPSLD